jgi:carboxypeptidase PM20D1
MFEWLAPEMPLPLRVVASNLWLFDRLLAYVMPMISPQAAALVRTTRATTIISGGTKENVLPSVANATINIRIAPHDTPDSVLADLRRIVTDSAITIKEDYFLGPSPYTPPTSSGFGLIQGAIRSVHPATPVAPALMIGNTDTRWYWKISDQIYRFNPVLLEKADIDRIHGVDERISLKGYDDCINFYYHVVKQL